MSEQVGSSDAGGRHGQIRRRGLARVRQPHVAGADKRNGLDFVALALRRVEVTPAVTAAPTCDKICGTFVLPSPDSSFVPPAGLLALVNGLKNTT